MSMMPNSSIAGSAMDAGAERPGGAAGASTLVEVEVWPASSPEKASDDGAKGCMKSTGKSHQLLAAKKYSLVYGTEHRGSW